MPVRVTTINFHCMWAALAIALHGAALSALAQHEAVANGPTALPLEVDNLPAETAPAQTTPQDTIDETRQDTVAPAQETIEQPISPAPSESHTPIFGGSVVSPDALDARSPVTSSGGWGMVRTLGALAVVIGLVLVLRSAAKWLATRAPSLGSQLTAGGRAPSGLLEVLGRYPVARGQKLVLLRLDRRVLLLSQTAAGFSTLAELADPEEVASILAKTNDEAGASLASRFTSVLRSMERDPELAPQDEVIDVDAVHAHPRSVRLAMQQDNADQIIEPKIAPRSGTDALTDRLRSMRERWA